MLGDGKAADASRVANQLLKRDPNDVFALILAAESAIAQSNFAKGIKYARMAYFQSDRPNDKFGAARLAALANSQMGRDTFALLWLRRARQFSPDAPTAEQVADDYRFLRDRNPWSTSLRFGATPSTNINNGSANETVTLFDIPGFDLSGDGTVWFADIRGH